jgi:hypothetical protein
MIRPKKMATKKTKKKVAKTKSALKAAAKAASARTKKKSSAKRRPLAKKAVAKKAVAKKAVAKKAVAKKAVAKKAVAKKRTAPKAQPVQRRDRAGHIDPSYAADLRAKAGAVSDDQRAFFQRPRSSDDLAEGLGEEAVNEMTSGENEGEDRLDQAVTEEDGGPFVETSAAEEFSNDIDLSNPEDATREPFPIT